MTDDQERLAARADFIFAYHHHLPPLPLLFLTNIIFMTINMIIIYNSIIIITSIIKARNTIITTIITSSVFHYF